MSLGSFSGVYLTPTRFFPTWDTTCINDTPQFIESIGSFALIRLIGLVVCAPHVMWYLDL